MPYRLPLSFLLPRLPSYLLGWRRLLSDDINALFRSVGQSPRTLDMERIPEREPFVGVMNHYHRPDLPAWWLAAASALVIAQRRVADAPPTGVMATQWTYEHRLGRAVMEPISRMVFARLLQTYDLIGMEPPILGGAATNRRANSVRRVVDKARAVKRNCGTLLIAPEGGDAPNGAMVRPPSGAGRFLLLLAANGLPFLPIAAWAEADQIIVAAGELFWLNDALRSGKHEKRDLDELVLQAAMGRVAKLLPGPLRGYYA